MIVHFVLDEKFIDQMIENFTKISKDHLFLVFEDEASKTFNYITYQGEYLKRFNFKKDDINEALSNRPNGIILHSINHVFANALLRYKQNVKTAWIVWGYGMYKLPNIIPSLFAPETKNFLKKTDPFIQLKWKLKKNKYLRYLYSIGSKNNYDPVSTVIRAIKKIDYFCTFIEEDFELFNKFYPENNLKYFELTFNTIGQYLANNDNLRISDDAKNVMIGNSNSIESNYLDAMDIVAEQTKEINKVFVILSYIENEPHKKEVIKRGKLLFRDRFHPLLEFIDRKKYIQLLQTCSVGIFNHYRQQAVGNIVALLYMGARVYLSENNPLYYFFRRNQLVINSIESDFKKYHVSRLDNTEAQQNRVKLNHLFSEEKVLYDLKQLINIVNN